MDTAKEASDQSPTSTAEAKPSLTGTSSAAAAASEAVKAAQALAAAAIERITGHAKSEPPADSAKIDAIAGQTIDPAPSEGAKIEIFPIDIAPLPPASSPNKATGSRFALLAASIALAAACGALAGALGASGLVGSAPASESRPGIDEARIMKDEIAQLRTDIAALKSSVDAASRNNNAQMSKITERFDRADRLQTQAAAKAAPDITGSIAPATAAAVPVPPPAPMVPGWIVRDVSRGVALIQGRIGLIEVEQGDVVPGLGRIEAIRRQDGRWVVLTARGMIASR